MATSKQVNVQDAIEHLQSNVKHTLNTVELVARRKAAFFNAADTAVNAKENDLVKQLADLLEKMFNTAKQSPPKPQEVSGIREEIKQVLPSTETVPTLAVPSNNQV